MENRKIPNEAINAAAEWWMKRISGPLGKDQLQRFKNNLVMLLSRKASIGFGVDCITLDCDYAPCGILSDAGKDADIPTANFPWKVTMAVKPDKVLVSDGYGMPWVQVWPIEHKNEGKEGAA